MNTVKALLLRRNRTLYLEPGNAASGANDDLLVALEARLTFCSVVLSARLRAVMRTLDRQELEKLIRGMMPIISATFGDVVQVFPQFKRFPEGVPTDTAALFRDRILAFYRQQPEQPCVLCQKEGTVHPVNPCAHLVCRSCWDGADYGGCPICHRKIDPQDPFLKPGPTYGALYAVSTKVRLLDLGTDLKADAQNLFRRLCKRSTALAPVDLIDVKSFLATYQAAVLPWLPPRIPVKETMATIFGELLKMQNPPQEVFTALQSHARTATDLLRVLTARAGGDPGLVLALKRNTSMPRSLRAGVLALLERMDPLRLAEDIQRWPNRWKRLAEKLHPFEYATRFPQACAALAAARHTPVEADTPLGALLLAQCAAFPENFTVREGKLRFQGWQAQVEAALAALEMGRSLDLLRQRPGDFSRRLDHLLMRAQRVGDPAVAECVAAFARLTSKMAPAILLTLMTHFAKRQTHFPKRVFFPKGKVLKAWATRDLRPALPAATCASIVSAVEVELLRRAALAGPVAAAVIDLALRDMPLPFNERTTARALLALPRGSFVPLEPAAYYRLFCHWTESAGQRADLDLSVSFYDDSWQFQDLCDYTNLTAFGGAAVHSGDYTSAPEPDGSAEYIDLDLAKLRAEGIRYAFMIVFSFNAIPFDRLKAASAGMMARENKTGMPFEPRTITQRFDLGGDAMVYCPLVVDLAEQRLLWLDANMAEDGDFHRIWEYRTKLAMLGRDFKNYFLHGARPSIWQAACLAAAARAQHVYVRGPGGAVACIARPPGASTQDFFRQLVALTQVEGAAALPGAGQPIFAALSKADFPLHPASTFYSLDFDLLPAELQKVRWQASDLVTAFAIEKG
jgi:hypothetical protein